MTTKTFIPDYRVPDGNRDVPNEDVVRYDIPHKADLVRKMVSDNPTINQITDEGLSGRPYKPEERESINGTPSPKFVTEDGSSIFSNHPEHYINPDLGHNTPKGAEIHQLEDRVMDKKTGKPQHFDELPEVKDLQYRMSLLPMINHILDTSMTPDEDNAKFKKYKNSLTRAEDHDYVQPKRDPTAGRPYDGFPHHAPESFTIRDGGNFDPEGHLKEANTIDFFKHAHNNISDMYLNHQDESIQEHLGAMLKSYNQLWDKLDSGEYERHPNFWSGHAFSAGNNRDTAWKQIQSQVPEISSQGKATGLRKNEDGQYE